MVVGRTCDPATVILTRRPWARPARTALSGAVRAFAGQIDGRTGDPAGDRRRIWFDC